MDECTWTERIESAARSDSFDADELAHLRACSHCSDLAGMIRLLCAEGRSAVRLAAERVPSADAILAQARSRRTGSDLRKVLWPIVWLERVAAVVGVLATIGVGWWLVQRVGGASAFDVIRSTGESSVSATSGDAASAMIPLAVLAVLTVASYGLIGLAGTTPRGR